MPTISIGGFPQDVSLRELKNLCKLCHGFMACSPNMRLGKPPTLFARFDSDEAAENASIMIQQMIFDEDMEPGKVLMAEWAHKEMGLDSHQQAQVAQMHQPQHQAFVPPAKRMRVAPEPAVPAATWAQPQMDPSAFAAQPAAAEADTLAALMPEGVDEASAHQFFSQMHGFVALKANANGKNCFVKFADGACAQMGMHAARGQGFRLDFANRNLEVDGRLQGLAVPTGPCTLACKAEPSFDEASTQQFFQSMNGFSNMKTAASGNNFFVRFQTHGHAQAAQGKARQAGFRLDFAKRELEDFPVQAAIPAQPQFAPVAFAPQFGAGAAFVPHASQAQHMAKGGAKGKANFAGAGAAAGGTITTLACKIEGSADETRAFFDALDGFEAFKANAAGSNCFVKFSDGDSAAAALEAAKAVGYTLDFAKRELM